MYVMYGVYKKNLHSSVDDVFIKYINVHKRGFLI